MMSRSQYPEHLNPFAEDDKPRNKLKISNSFREIGRTIRQSFRRKKKEPKTEEPEVEIRRKPAEPVRRLPVTYAQERNLVLPLPLPRSRFKERLAKGRHTYHPDITRDEPSTPVNGEDSTFNPFEENEANESSKDKSMRKRRKKKAPLPPNKSISSQDVNDDRPDVPHASHWSLTSADSEFTYSTDNISERDYHIDIDRLSLADDFTDFNKEMEKLNDERNNNVITSKEQPDGDEPMNKETNNNNIPDLVITCDCDNSKVTDIHEVQKSEIDVSENKDVLVVSDANDNDQTDDDRNLKNNNTSDIKMMDEVEPEVVVSNNSDNITNIQELFLYNERKSLYIAGSQDYLHDSKTYTGSVSLYITGSTDQLDNAKNEPAEELAETKSDDESVPVPKQRKHKLSKSSLLGTTA